MDLIRESFEKVMNDKFDTRLLRDGDGYAGKIINQMWNLWLFAHTVAADNNVKFQPLDTNIADMFSAEDWGEDGAMWSCDGIGYWCHGNLESDVSCFETRPEWADSVAWYNK